MCAKLRESDAVQPGELVVGLKGRSIVAPGSFSLVVKVTEEDPLPLDPYPRHPALLALELDDALVGARSGLAADRPRLAAVLHVALRRGDPEVRADIVHGIPVNVVGVLAVPGLQPQYLSVQVDLGALPVRILATVDVVLWIAV